MIKFRVSYGSNKTVVKAFDYDDAYIMGARWAIQSFGSWDASELKVTIA